MGPLSQLIWRVIADAIIFRAGLISQPAQEPHQMHGHRNGLLAETDSKPFADFAAECCAMNVIDSDVSAVRGRDHEISDLQNEVAERGWQIFSDELSLDGHPVRSLQNPAFANRRK